LLAECRNIPANELIQVVCQLQEYVVDQLRKGYALDLTQEKVTVLWVRTAFNSLIVAVLTELPYSFEDAAENIQKNITERLAVEAVSRRYYEL